MAALSNAQVEAVAAVERVCAADLDSRALRCAVVDRLRRVMPLDAYCFGTLDPETLLINDHVSDGVPASGGPVAAYNEYHVPDVDKFADLAKSPGRVGILSRSTRGDLESSHRFRTVLSLIGVHHEMRAAFVVDGRCWGAIDLFRTADRPDFSAADADVLRAVSRPVARALRRAVARTTDLRTVASDTGVLVVDRLGATVMANEAARRWLAEGVGELAVAEVALAAGASRSAVRLRVRSRAGAWVSLQASPVASEAPSDEAVAVVIDRAAVSDIVEMVVLAYGLSPRERQVLEYVAAGLRSALIAAEMHITRNTVQDHLKSIFAKCGVNSRAQLMSLLLGP